jgi:hypothetical protein
MIQQAASALLNALARPGDRSGIPDLPAAGREDAICPTEGRDLEAVLAQVEAWSAVS